MRATASDWQNGSKFRKVGGEFLWGWVYILIQEKCYHSVWKVFRGLLLAIFCNGTFSNVKQNLKMLLARRFCKQASDWQKGRKFRKVGGEFSGGWVYILLQEKCYHTIWKVFRGLLLAFFFNDRFSNVKLYGNVNVKRTWQTWN